MDKGTTISTSTEDVNVTIKPSYFNAKPSYFWKANNDKSKTIITDGIEQNRILQEAINQKEDVVNHPKHYTSLIFPEVIDMMTTFFTKDEVLAFCKLNAFKYRMRCGNKNVDTIAEDIAKAMWYETKYKELTTVKLNPKQIIKG